VANLSATEQLLDALDNSREMLLMAIEPLPDEGLLAKQAVGEWSIRDVLNNITAWEAELVTGMMRLRQKKRPTRLLEALDNPDLYDEQRYLESLDRDLDQIFHDFQQVRMQVEEWISEFSEQELSRSTRFQFLRGKSVREIIAAATYEREKRFIPFIQLFAQQWIMLEESEGAVHIPFAANGGEKEDLTDEDTD
jgi:hypothetical protein